MSTTTTILHRCSARLYSHAAALRYFVPRNANGSLPVYSDVRNNGTRYRTLIRHVDGHVHTLAQDLRATLLRAASSTPTARAKVEVTPGNGIIISGGRWKKEVIEWLKARGF